jgi:Fic family protein
MDGLYGDCLRARELQGRLSGKMEALGFQMQNQAYLESLSTEVLKNSEIEGNRFDMAEVRSSVARNLGMEIPGLVFSSRAVDGAVEMQLDAMRNAEVALTKVRLFAWHRSLFPGGQSGMLKIKTGQWRDEDMQVVSGAMGKEKVHFEAPKAKMLEEEMKAFLDWYNNSSPLDLNLKAGIAHLWFLTIHPFEDGNGRIARALTDMLLARIEPGRQKFYSISAEIMKQRKSYYEILQATQQGGLDISNWLIWFLDCLQGALQGSEELVKRVFEKHRFWLLHKDTLINKRQKKVINMLLGDFEGKLNNAKWAKLNKCSSDTALRDINDLLEKGILTKNSGRGRSTSYSLIIPD